MSPKRILVVLVARIGDTLLGTPVMRALKARYPGASLTVLAHPKRMAVLENLDFIDQLGSITPKTAFFRHRFGAKPYDLAVLFGNDAPLLKLARRVAPRVVAFSHDGELDHPALRFVPRPTPDAPLHAVKERLLLAEAADAAPVDLRLCYRVRAAEQRTAAAWLQQHLPPQAGPLIGLQPYSFPTKAHRDWPLDNFFALIAAIRSQYPQAHFLIFGDGLAQRKLNQVTDRIPPGCTLCAGKFSLRETAALMAELDLYVGVDTGPTHIVGALGIPMVALYHCAYPGRLLAPLEHPALRVVEHPLTGASRSSEESMDQIPVAQVAQAALELLSSQAAEAP
ncbi:MAG TPA: glycosyltransferase family 9 protein [Rhodocyclaceae bacterium]